MKTILIFGAGMVAGPPVQYLLNKGFKVIVASRTVAKAKNLIRDNSNGVAKAFDITSSTEDELETLILECDLAVSLLPYIYHTKIARVCIKHNKHMVTTSYVSPEMQELDEKAKKANITILNEIGVDPGIDHMSAKLIIDNIHGKNGKVLSFTSYTGGLPAPDANNNPWGYKLSWSPRGVILAGRNPAKYLEEETIVEIPGEELFDHYIPFPVNEKGPGDAKVLGMLEGYPNRNSIEPYVDVYDIPETKTMIRGTLRNPGWCRTMKKIADIGYLDLEEQEFPDGFTYGNLTNQLLNKPIESDPKKNLSEFFRIEENDDVITRFDWMGLLRDIKVPSKKISPLDALCHQFEENLQYSPGERDMLVMVHQFVYELPSGKEKLTSTMIDYGIPNGDSSMSRTVGLPAAIGVRMILENKIKDRGVLRPVKKSVYNPILQELEALNIGFIERVEKL
ncbi:MAG: saccharopine dehydrogenase C-terminal domain-containing protein [Candidatus Hodarchaeales archaeon]|jgi:saccharopine dehydrogenase (NADP+, L-glutamate forming)/spermidine synthase